MRGPSTPSSAALSRQISSRSPVPFQSITAADRLSRSAASPPNLEPSWHRSRRQRWRYLLSLLPQPHKLKPDRSLVNVPNQKGLRPQDKPCRLVRSAHARRPALYLCSIPGTEELGLSGIREGSFYRGTAIVVCVQLAIRLEQRVPHISSPSRTNPVMREQ